MTLRRPAPTAGCATVLRAIVASVFLCLATGPLAAQTDSVSRPAAGVTPVLSATDVARHLAAIAADSTWRTDTTTMHREAGTLYVADEFATLGLGRWPGVGVGSNPWLQLYPMAGQRPLDSAMTTIAIGTFVRRGGVEVLDEDGNEVTQDVHAPVSTTLLVRGTLAEGANGRYLGRTLSGVPRRPTAVVVAGPHTLATAANVAAYGKVVFYVPPAGIDSLLEQRIVDTLMRRGAGVVVITDTAAVRRATAHRLTEPPARLIDQYMRRAQPAAWALYVRADTLTHLLALAGVDWAQLRQVRAPVARETLPLGAWANVPPLPDAAARPMAVNVLGLLEGRDSLLKGQYVVVSVHLDRADASGVAGLLAVARVLSAPAARPRRSVLFVVASGAEQGFAGAEYAAGDLNQMQSRPVANLTLDRIGGGAGDSVTVDGLEEIDVGLLLSRVIAAQPDAEVTPVSGSIATAPCADHCAFVRHKVPSLYLHDAGVTHETAPAAHPDRIVRMARFASVLVQAVANADRPARWTAEIAPWLAKIMGD